MDAKSPLKQKPLRLPGQSVDEEVQRLFNDKLLDYVLYTTLLAAMALAEWIGYWLQSPRRPWIYTVLTLCAAIFAAIKIRPIRASIRALKLGRDGERIVAEQLDVLKRNGALIFHDVPGDYFNLDHVIVCEKGIFVVETKTISKRHSKAKVLFDGEFVLVDGYAPDRNPVDQVNAQVSWLRARIKSMTGRDFNVRGVLVYPNWWVETKKGSERKSLWVLEPKALPQWIANEPTSLSKEDGSLVGDRVALHVRSGSL